MSRPRSALLAALIPGALLLVGVYLGYRMAYQAAAPGFMQRLVYIWTVPIALVALTLIVVGLRKRRRSGPGWTGRGAQALASGLALAIGTTAGIALTPVLGLAYKAPIVMRATGTAALALPGVAEFAPNATAMADCGSIPDGLALATVSVADAGTLRGTRLIVFMTRDPSDPDSDSMSVELGGEAGRNLVWARQAALTTTDADGRSGTATFADAVGEDAALKTDPGASPFSIDPWPISLSGSLTWSCGDWHPEEPED